MFVSKPRLMFDFALWPIPDVLPWGEEGEKCLHWFGLTDGWYTINIGGVQLLRYNQQLIDSTPQWEWRTPYFAYQVARLHDDLLDVLPYAIEPVPSDLLDFIRTPFLEDEFLQRCSDAEDDWPADETGSLRSRITGWLHDRVLSYGHMRGQPEIRFWTEVDTLHIRWRSFGENEPETGLPWSTVEDGSFAMPRSCFIAEVRNFHDRLIAQMAERVEVAQNAWPLPAVAVDINELTVRQAEASRALDDALLRAGGTSWDDIRTLITRHVR